MSQFKRFNSSDNTNWDTYASYPPGTLTWNPDNGLRLHDGSTGGGSPVGGSSNFYDLTNRPTGNTAVHDLQGGSSSLLNGYFLQQTSTGVSEWSALPTTYDTLTIDTKIIGGIDGAGGTQITGIEASLGSGAPYRYAFIGGNDAFGNLFNRGSALIGWKMYPASDPSAFVTITEFLETSLGAPSLGFSGSLGQGPWVAESSDYSAGANGPLTLSADTKNWVLGTDGVLTLPAGGSIRNSDGVNIVPQGLSAGDSPEFAGLYIGGSSGNEGGEIRLALAANTTLEGNGVSIDVYANQLRIFENGGSARGVYIDLSEADSDVGTNLLAGGGGTTLPADASGYLNNNGSGTLTWVAGNPTGSGMLPYNGVTVVSNTVVGDWTEYTLSGTMDAFYDWNNTYTTITLSSQTAYGKEITVNTKNLWINDSKINSNNYLVIEFPSTPSVGDVFSIPIVNTLTTVNAGSFVVGETYTIVTPGTTNWTSIGAQYGGAGQSFVATGVGSGTGTATTSTGAKKVIFKPASGHRAQTMAQGNLGPIVFGQGGAYDFMYIDLSGLNANNPITWVYAGLIDSIPTWYQFYF
jgi:hypothetical protein